MSYLTLWTIFSIYTIYFVLMEQYKIKSYLDNKRQIWTQTQKPYVYCEERWREHHGWAALLPQGLDALWLLKKTMNF